MYSLRVFLVCLLGFAAAEGAIFHSGLYARILNPASSSGAAERTLEIEQTRPKEDANQIIGIGDSRMALVPRIANELTPETGYTFGSMGIPGTTPRIWYYLLRGLDPKPGKYAAVVVTLEDFDGNESREHFADRYYDLLFLVNRLRISDLREYAGSMDTPAYRWEAARTILFRASGYAKDFQDFGMGPKARLEFIRLNRVKNWGYEWVAPARTVKGARIDFEKQELDLPPELEDLREDFHDVYLTARPPATGAQAKYLGYWLGKIVDHYRGSRTKVVFVRIARGGFVRPDTPPANPHSPVREIPGAILIDEHMFEDLERPEMFQDALHLNREGLDRFTRRLARELRRILGPGTPSGVDARPTR